MIQKIFVRFLRFLSRVTKKTIISYNKNINNSFGKTAVKSSYGFWYVGNVFDLADIAYGIANNGAVEGEQTKLVQVILTSLLDNNGEINFYDIGANTGYYGVFAAWFGCGKILVHSFDPLVENINCLKESVCLNRLDNIVICHDVALGDVNTTKVMFTAGSGSSFEMGFLGNSKAPRREVVMRRLDDMVAEKEMPLADFIKIDVEGYELKVLQGARNTITSSLPVIFAEIAFSLRNIGRRYINHNYEETFEYLKQLGYRVFVVDDCGLREYDYKHPIDGAQMFLFLHPKKHGPQINQIIK